MAEKSPAGIFRGISHILRRELLWWKMYLSVSRYNRIAMLQFDTFEKRLYRRMSAKQKRQTVAGNDYEFSVENIIVKRTVGVSVAGIHRKTLESLGYSGVSAAFNLFPFRNADVSALSKKLNIDFSKKLIAVAPFSRGKSKIYHPDKMEAVLAHFTDSYQVVVLGGGTEEQLVNAWITNGCKVISVINKLSFSEELLLITRCSVVLTMDSANLHLASLLGTPVVSVWGATTPRCGYYPDKEPLERTIVKGIDCQPCSLFGEKPCTNVQPYACMDIEPDVIVEKINKVLE
jgi:ADP-heptose:LPS heptosyltransferase